MYCLYATFIDLSKAFDTMDYDILFHKLEKLGIRGLTLTLIKSYFSDRVQVIKIKNILSNKKVVKIGVPQGSILGPLFFIIYINDLLDLIDNITSYADDTVLFCSGNTWSEAENTMNRSLAIVNSWYYSNKLILNINKTMYVTFGNRNDTMPRNLTIHLDNHLLNRVQSTTYIGVIFDQNIKWKEHIKSVYKRTRYLMVFMLELTIEIF